MIIYRKLDFSKNIYIFLIVFFRKFVFPKYRIFPEFFFRNKRNFPEFFYFEIKEIFWIFFFERTDFFFEINEFLVLPKTRKRNAEWRKISRKKKGKSGKLFFKFRRFSKNSAFFSYLKRGIPHFKKNKIKRGKFRGKIK